jgi:hypothetical protein
MKGYFLTFPSGKLWVELPMEMQMPNQSEFKSYRKSQLSEARPYIPNETLARVSVSPADIDNGSPKEGDMIFRNPNNHDDMWLVAEDYFKSNYEPVV